MWALLAFYMFGIPLPMGSLGTLHFGIRIHRSPSRDSHAIQSNPDSMGYAPKGAYRALCARCAKSWPFSTTGSSVSSEDWKDVIEWLLQSTGL